jgi:hypothetical protein
MKAIESLSMLGKNFIDYAVVLLFKDRMDHLFSFIIFTFIVFVLSAVLFISNAIQYDLLESTSYEPDIVVENTKAGRGYVLDDYQQYDIAQIPGVGSVEGFVDGRYYFAQKRLYFHIVSDENLQEDEMVIGQGVKEAMKELYYRKSFNFFTEDQVVTLTINKIAPPAASLLANDVIFVHPNTARAILGLKEKEFSKLFVYVPNANEVGEISLKINELFPYAKISSKEDRIAAITHLFYYKGGVFLMLYTVVMLSFFIVLKNQIALAYGQKRQEIAVLRSLGFCIKDIIALKLIQNGIVAVSAYLLGIALAYMYVFFANAPLLRWIFLGSELPGSITFTPSVDVNLLFLIFIFGVIPFLAFVILPSWKIAISDMSEAMKA